MLRYKLAQVGVLPGGTCSRANGINDKGQIVGVSQNDKFTHSFIYDTNTGQMNDLGVLPGTTNSWAHSINDDGQVVGLSDWHGFIYSNGAMTDLSDNLVPYRINNKGHFVGTTRPTISRAFLYINGQVVDLGALPGDQYSVALAINNKDQVTGYSAPMADPRQPDDAFLYSDGIMTGLGYLAGTATSRGVGINDLGHVVGNSGNHAFVFKDGRFIDIGSLANANYAFAKDINNKGQIVGVSGDGRIFLYSDGQMYDMQDLVVNVAGWKFSDVHKINNLGNIVGEGLFYGVIRGFLLIKI
jgi:probable HAF family extracellular repeat protein